MRDAGGKGKSFSVHPRACGEHSPAVVGRAAIFGSSPRLRGTCLPKSFSHFCLRFIPALAGNIAFSFSIRASSSVHPRACGEHISSHGCFFVTGGSSPRLRGTFMALQIAAPSYRFIPALAGNIHGRPAPGACASVHPRACGEHSLSPLIFICPPGSSPRLRGTCHCRRRRTGKSRFIPALAGNMQHKHVLNALLAVHPRACGEHLLNVAQKEFTFGSSPRLRGTSRPATRSTVARRFIPALAGNMFLLTVNHFKRAVHPRACGEHYRSNDFEDRSAGSSPRLRGTCFRAARCYRQRWFIPALAGNMQDALSSAYPVWVHPRACGEHPVKGSPRPI